MTSLVRTRFAPSPTGSLHVGGARTALYCLLVARKAGGRFLLRIEDTDQARSTEEAAHGLIRDLTWLGLTWDEGPGTNGDAGPYFQSQRLPLYNGILDALLASGHAYEAWETPAELSALRAAAEAAKENFRYRRRPVDPAQVEAWRAEGRVPVLRLAAPDHAIRFEDDVLGPVHVAADELEDIVIRKADGFPTYHFAVVVDDHHMGVTQILRGQEHLMNTPKHLGLYEALGWTPPTHGHMPLIFNPTGSKMSKRDKAKAAREGAVAAHKARGGADGYAWLADAIGTEREVVESFMAKKHDGVAVAEAIGEHLGVTMPMIEVMDFRRGGYLPEGLLNYLALLGWSPGGDREVMTMDELVALFEVGDINKSAARFDAVKLTALNGEHIRRATITRLEAAHDAYLEVAPQSPLLGCDPALRRALLALYQPRMSTFADLDRLARFFFLRPDALDPDAVKKHLLKGDALDLLARARAALAALPAPWGATDVDAALQALADATGLGVGKFAQPLRVAVSGTSVSPPIGETLALLGQGEVLARIDAVATLLPAAP
jgi:glutamyl-tRNA synthetase